MKNFINKKLCLILIISQFLSSCTITRGVWLEDRDHWERIQSFFIDEENSRVVLIGEKSDSYSKNKNEHYHYSIKDPTKKLLKIFELAQKSSDINFAAYSPEARGSKVTGGFWIGFRKQNLSTDEIKFLEKEGLTKGKNKKFVGLPCRFDNEEYRKDSYKWPLAQTIRYPSSQEPLKNLCLENNKTPNCIKITKFQTPWQGVIWNRYTTSEKAARVAATPFTIIADILMTPLYIIGVFGMASSKGD